MKFNFTVDISDCYEGYDIQNEILDRATEAFINQIIGSKWEEGSLSYELEQRINNKVSEIMSKDFKDIVANKIAEKLEERFEKSKQYKELIKGKEIESDYAMRCGLKGLVADIVKTEMKNMFK